jgi:DNA primase
MLLDRDLVERIAERHGPQDFRDANYGAIFSALLSAGHADPLDVIAETLPTDAFHVLRELTESGEAHPPEAADVSLSLARFDARPVEARIDEIRATMRQASPEMQDALMRERLELEVELRRLLPIRSPRGKGRG